MSLADNLIDRHESELDSLDQIINRDIINTQLSVIRSDYGTLSLFKLLLLQTWHNLSDESLSQAVRRDIVYMNFCGFSLKGKN